MELAHEVSLVRDHSEDGALPEGEDGRGAGYLVVLQDPLLPSLPLVCGGEVRVQVVRVDVEGDEAERLEGGWVHDRHVVGRIDADSRHVGSGAGPDVWNPLLQNLPFIITTLHVAVTKN